MPVVITFGFAVLLAYVIGCWATGYYLVRFLTGRDIRTTGSGGTGGRNVDRLLGRQIALMTILGDAGKGALAVIAATFLAPHQYAVAPAMVAVTAGHIWPIQLGFRGGKGVATSLGALLAWSLLLYVLFVGIFLTGLFFSRKAAVSAIIAYIALPFIAAIVGKTLPEIILLAALSAIIVFLHRGALREIAR